MFRLKQVALFTGMIGFLVGWVFVSLWIFDKIPAAVEALVKMSGY